MVAHPPDLEPVLSFDRFDLLPRQRLLLEDGTPVRLGSRALDLLVALLERPGTRIGKAELLARAWPGIHVVEGNLKFQIAALRRALRDGQDGRRFIETSKGQGYCFVAPVTVTAPPERSPAAPDGPRRHNLPERLTPLIARDAVIAKLADQLTLRRLITIVGPGGIGKTSVALAVAERVVGRFEDGVWVVDLARLAEPGQLRGAVAAGVGLEVGPGLTTPGLVGALRDRRMLLVLDNCAHLIDAAAELVAAIMRAAPGIRILATSREPLRCEGEHLCRLDPLDTPPPGPIGAAEARRYPAVQLFVDQVAASLDGFQLVDDTAPLVTEICRKLDGIPLALELAAPWVGILGLQGLASQLDDRLRVLTGGRRTALPKHRTMRAAVAWSHDLLSPPEQTVFRRLAIFAGGFSLAAAAAVAADRDLPGDEVVRLVLDLAAKSLVVADRDAPTGRFRLLETTRAYALERLRDGGELQPVARRHAEYILERLGAAAREDADGAPAPAVLEADTDNLRVALNWAFAEAGDAALGVRLAAAALPLWFAMSLQAEAHAWSERAIRMLDAAGLRGSRQEMRLQTAFAISLQMVQAGTSDAHAALSRALELAEQLGDTDHRLHVLHSLWVHHIRIGEVGASLALAHRAEALAGPMADPDASATAEWMLGIALHFAGEHRSARRRLEGLLLAPASGARRRQLVRAGFDPYLTARCVLAHLLWVQGCPDEAADAMRVSLDEARRIAHPVTLCSTLAFGACPLALLAGELDTASRCAAELVDHAGKHALADHLSYGMVAQEIIALRRAGASASPAQLRAALERWNAAHWHVLLDVREFAEAATASGLAGELLAIIDEALRLAERDQDLWAYPETLRVRGELLLKQTRPDPRQARGCFQRSLDRARAQGALAWQLRSATSLHRLDLRDGDASPSRAQLSQTVAQFKEGADTPDLRAARALLAEGPGRRADQD